MNLELLFAEDAENAAALAANGIHAALEAHLQRHDQACFIASGGSTPQRCYELLSEMALPWERVRVTLTDERVVPVTDPSSNEGMLRRTLLQHNAAAAEFVPVQKDSLNAVPRPLACALVGMGEDGHFASLFPDNPDLAGAIAPYNPSACLPVTTAASELPRVSLSLAYLLQCETIFLLALGQTKRAIIDQPAGFPVAALFQQARTPVQVIWAP